MSKRKITVEEAEQDYRDAFRTGSAKDIMKAKEILDWARLNSNENDKSPEELTELYLQALRDDKISKAMNYYYALLSARKRTSNNSEQSFESQVMDDVIKQMKLDSDSIS